MASTTGSDASVPSATQSSNNAGSPESSTSGPGVAQQAGHLWPPDTEIIVFPGTTKALLTIQSPLMCSIFQDAFEYLRATLLFIHAFPDPTLTRSMISEALSVATQSHLPKAANIRKRLEVDDEYVAKMCRIVSFSLVSCFEYVPADAVSPVHGFPFSEERPKSGVLG